MLGRRSDGIGRKIGPPCWMMGTLAMEGGGEGCGRRGRLGDGFSRRRGPLCWMTGSPATVGGGEGFGGRTGPNLATNFFSSSLASSSGSPCNITPLVRSEKYVFINCVGNFPYPDVLYSHGFHVDILKYRYVDNVY